MTDQIYVASPDNQTLHVPYPRDDHQEVEANAVTLQIDRTDNGRTRWQIGVTFYSDTARTTLVEPATGSIVLEYVPFVLRPNDAGAEGVWLPADATIDLSVGNRVTYFVGGVHSVRATVTGLPGGVAAARLSVLGVAT